MANRYTRGPIAATVQSQFVPLPLEYMEKFLQRRQNKYDVSKAITDKVETELGKFKFLGQDTPQGRAHLQEYRNKINQMVEDVGYDYSQLNAKTDQLKKEFTADVTGGYLGATTASYQNYAANVADIDKMVMKGDMTKERADWRKSQLLSNFAGTAQDETGWHSYQKQTVGRDFDVEETMNQLGKDVHDQYTSTGDAYLGLGYVTKRIKANFMNDPEAMNFVKDEVQRLYNPKTKEELSKFMKQYIDTKAKHAASLQTFYKVSERNIAAADKKRELSLTTPITDMVKMPDAAKVNIPIESMITKTSDIISKIARSNEARIGINPITGLPQEVATSGGKSEEAIKYKNALDIVNATTKGNGIARDYIRNRFTDEQLLKLKPSEFNKALQEAYKQDNIAVPLAYDSFLNNTRIQDETLNLVKYKNLASFTLHDADGHELSKKEADDYKLNWNKAKAEGDSAILKSTAVIGEVNKPGTKFDLGSKVLTAIGPDGESRTVILSPNVETNKKPEYIASKLLDARRSYESGVSTTTTFRAKSPITGKFVNFDAIGTATGVNVYDPARPSTPLNEKELGFIIGAAQLMKIENENHTLKQAYDYNRRTKARIRR